MSHQKNFGLIIDNNWEAVKREMRHTWRKLTEEDVEQIYNYKDLVKKLEEVYEMTEDEISIKIDSFIEKLSLEPNLTRMQELTEAFHQKMTNAKETIGQKLNFSSLQKNVEDVQTAVTKYVKENPLKAVGLGVLAAVAIKKMLFSKAE